MYKDSCSSDIIELTRSIGFWDVPGLLIPAKFMPAGEAILFIKSMMSGALLPDGSSESSENILKMFIISDMFMNFNIMSMVWRFFGVQ